jgi:hypothetical protein
VMPVCMSATMEPVAEVNPIPFNDECWEETFLKYVGTLFHIDERGYIWRVAIMRKGVVVPCSQRRAEQRAPNGYLRVRFMLNGIRHWASAHRIVYRYFKGEIPPNAIINHDDRMRGNNHPSNLIPASQSQNIMHGGRWKRESQIQN